MKRSGGRVGGSGVVLVKALGLVLSEDSKEMIHDLELPPTQDASAANEGLVQDSLLKMWYISASVLLPGGEATF